MKHIAIKPSIEKAVEFFDRNLVYITTVVKVNLQTYYTRKVEIESRFQGLVVVFYSYANSRTDRNI